MTDSALAIVLLTAFIPALYAARFFRTLDSRFWSWARAPLVGGLAVGVIFSVLPFTGSLRLIAVGALLTITAAYARRVGDESEPIEGMALGAMTGAAAALPAVLLLPAGIDWFAEALLSGTIAGLGITWASRFVNDKPRQIVIDLATGAAAIAGAAIPRALVRAGLPAADIAITIAGAILLVIVASVFREWSDLKAELSHEASLGFIDDSQVRSSTHPILRLGRGGWVDRKARREYVRLANKLALRKRHQRFRPDETARLYQLEIIKLRMTLQDLARVEHDVRRSAERDDPSLHAAVASRHSK